MAAILDTELRVVEHRLEIMFRTTNAFANQPHQLVPNRES